MISILHGIDIYGNIERSIPEFEQRLKRAYPNEGRMIHILTTLATWGINYKLKDIKFITEQHIQDMTVQIEEEFGFAEKYAKEAVMIWVRGLKRNLVLDQSLQEENSQVVTPEREDNDSIVYVEGDESEFEIIQREDGYYISHFSGFEEEEMVIPNMVNGKKIIGIAEYSFKGCTLVKKIKICDGIEVIGSGAFQNCRHLEEVIFPSTLREIRSNCTTSYVLISPFDGCLLREAILPENVSNIERCAFKDCYFLEKVVLPNQLSTIHYNTFDSCARLKEISLPENLMVIDKNAFDGCKSLSNITLPKNLSFIGEEAFSECSIKEIHIPLGTKTIGSDAFYKNPLEAIYIPPTVTEIGYREHFKNSENDNGYTFGSLRDSKLIIYTTAGSRAMEYARKRGIQCKKAEFK